MVSAALPGGDPLAAALAAGETPSPQLVAAAGETTGLPVRTALLSLTFALLGLIAVYWISSRTSGLSQMDLPYKSRSAGATGARFCAPGWIFLCPADSASGFSFDDDYLEHLDHAGGRHPDWDKVLRNRPSVLHYWQRQSPDYLVPANLLKSSLLIAGVATLDDPPPTLSGMVAVSLDPQGRLARFDAVPPQKDTAAVPSQPYDWSAMFNMAGLDMTQFHSTQPIWNSLGASDQQAAWTGVWPGTTLPLRVEAGSWRGKPVFFRLISDWTKPDRMPSSDSSQSKALEILLTVFLLLLLGTAVWLARRNYLQDKSDQRGALRLGLLIFVLQMLVWIFIGHFVPGVGSFAMFVLAACGAVFLAAIFYTVYLALEPYVRRHWPRAIISWSRLMAGRIRDPLVGRDVLFGVMLGVSWSLIFSILFLALRKISAEPQFGSLDLLMGARHGIGTLPGAGYRFRAGNPGVLFSDVCVSSHFPQTLAGGSGLRGFLDHDQGGRRAPSCSHSPGLCPGLRHRRLCHPALRIHCAWRWEFLRSTCWPTFPLPPISPAGISEARFSSRCWLPPWPFGDATPRWRDRSC